MSRCARLASTIFFQLGRHLFVVLLLLLYLLVQLRNGLIGRLERKDLILVILRMREVVRQNHRNALHKRDFILLEILKTAKLQHPDHARCALKRHQK